jgi:hypothetical protein
MKRRAPIGFDWRWELLVDALSVLQVALANRAMVACRKSARRLLEEQWDLYLRRHAIGETEARAALEAIYGKRPADRVTRGSSWQSRSQSKRRALKSSSSQRSRSGTAGKQKTRRPAYRGRIV